jgi:hypothetical protein
MSSLNRIWRQLLDDKAGLAGFSIVLVFFLIAAGVWAGTGAGYFPASRLQYENRI